MKKLLLLLFTPFIVYSQPENFNNELLRTAEQIKGVDIDKVAKINPGDKEKILNLDRIKKADAILLDTKIQLLYQARLDLHHKLLIYRATERIKREAEEREILLASIWQKSRTGRIDGRSWFDLFEDERKEYRKLYFDSFKK